MLNNKAEIAHRVTWLGFITNAALTAFKFIAGIFGHSEAMVADAVHSLSDLATDIVVLISLRISGKPADANHDYGHGKYETLATAFIGTALLMAGIGIFRHGILKIWYDFHGTLPGKPGMIAFFAAIVSVIVKEWLYRFTLSAGKRIDSPAVIANAWHHRSDAFSSVGTLAGIGGAVLLGDAWHVLDPLAAVVMSLIILRTAILILIRSFRELTDESLEEHFKKEILNIISADPRVFNAHNLRTRRIGSVIAIDIHICVDPTMNVSEAHAIASETELQLRRRFGADTFISIHIEPYSEVKDSRKNNGSF